MKTTNLFSMFLKNSITLVFLSMTLSSCGGDSQKQQTAPLNFSVNKFNEDLVGSFYLPEMEVVLQKLNSISNKTKNCVETIDLDVLKDEWRTLALTYQKLWPLNHATLDRVPEVSALQAPRYLSGAYSYSPCDLQLNLAEKAFYSTALIHNPAINSLEFLLYGNPASKNQCKTVNAIKIDEWMATSTKDEDVCKQINFISGLAQTELNKIYETNKSLYSNGKSEEIFSSNNVQKVYDSLAIFTDQVLKDQKISQPLGFSEKLCNFKDRTCPTAVEHRLSNLAFEVISKNLEGIMAAFNEQTQMSKAPINKGLFQFLRINNNGDLANKIYNNILNAHKISTSLHGQNFYELSLELDNAESKKKCSNATSQSTDVPVCALRQSVQELSDSVKVDLRIALALSTTRQIEGDSD